MKINEVEKQTGLTAKSIRFYEAKGLIEVSRNEENGYRFYTEENVRHLKRIKLLRYLEFSIEEIHHLQKLELPEIQRIPQKQAEKFEDQEVLCDMKKELCVSLSKDFDMENGMVDEYDEAIEWLEKEEFSEFREVIKNFSCPSLVQMIVWTLVFGAPIAGLFINLRLHNGNPGLLTVSAVFALFGTVFLSLQWRNYIQKRKYQKARIKEKNKHEIWIFPVMLIAVVMVIAVFLLVNDLVIALFAPDGWLFYEFQGGGDWLLILITEIPFMGALLYLIERLRRVPERQSGDLAWFFSFLWKHKVVSACIWCILFYLSIVHVTFVTPDTIVSYSVLRPTGVVHHYDEITQVKASFGWKNFAFREYKKKGTFSYRIYFDGSEVVFSQPYVNEEIERYEETYMELEEFDAKVMSYGVAKEGSEQYAEDCDLDKRYVDCFLRIIRNTR